MGIILLADDQRDSRARLQGLLEGQGFAVIAASTLGMAVPLAKSDPPDLAFLNISRSRDEGWSACRDIRRFCPKAKILLCIEGGPTEDEVALGREAGADEVLPEVRGLAQITKFLEAASVGHSLTCPECQSVFRLQQMPVPGSRVEAQCPECHFLIGVMSQGQEAVTLDAPLNGRPKILVVEDTKFFRAYLTDLLVGAGFDVVTAQDGIEALEYLSRECPDLVITDVLMPRMHGFDLCRKIKDRPETASVPVIMMTQVYTR
ncbi:MAG TPA: response regulator, partial [Candidatus Methylomirabilis sp.]|nr:response regulator [Candidatus Methylomirabilis sp.]